MSAVTQGDGEVKQMCKGAEHGEGHLEHRWEQTWQTNRHAEELWIGKEIIRGRNKQGAAET